MLPSIVQMQDEGVANFSTNLTHAAVAAMIVTQVFAIESFLSALWGTMHTQSVSLIVNLLSNVPARMLTTQMNINC